MCDARRAALKVVSRRLDCFRFIEEYGNGPDRERVYDAFPDVIDYVIDLIITKGELWAYLAMECELWFLHNSRI